MNIVEITAQFCHNKQLAVEKFEHTTSTNDHAKKDTSKSELKLFVASHQTQGRGRGENSWLDQDATQLLVSFALQLKNSPQHTTAPRVGLNLFRAVQTTWPQLAWSLKAPNDLLLSGKKVAGLLVETQSQGNNYKLIIGLGFNLLSHPEEFTQATHLNSELGLDGNLNENHLVGFLDNFCEQLQQSQIDFTQSLLSNDHREELLVALNANPNKAKIFLDVSENCDLICENESFSWKDL